MVVDLAVQYFQKLNIMLDHKPEPSTLKLRIQVKLRKQCNNYDSNSLSQSSEKALSSYRIFFWYGLCLIYCKTHSLLRV